MSANIREYADRDIRVRIGQKIKEWRLERNLTQRAVAEDACISLLTLQQLEKGATVKTETLIRVLRILRKLDALQPFFEEKGPDPILMADLEHRMHHRKRASKLRKKNI